jgi:glycosyltransferase involved in cell wall biosynthesis
MTPVTSETLKSKIKVLRVIARLNIGGPAIHSILLTRYLDSLDYKTLLVAGQVGLEEGDMSYLAEAEGVKPVIISKLGRRLKFLDDLIAFVRLLQLFMNFRPHIVHTHTAKAGALGRVAAGVYNLIQGIKFRFRSKSQVLHAEQTADSKSQNTDKECKVVHTFHGHVLRGYFSPFKSSLFRFVERILAKLTDVIVVVSEQQKHELVTSLGIGIQKQYAVVPLGFELTSFGQCSRSKHKFSKSLGFAENRVRLVGIVGRLTPIKNHHLFLEAARLVTNIYGDDNTRFLIVGDGELRADLENVTEQLALVDQVIFTGWIRDLPSLYADLDILALTSNNEGTPVAVIEAMAAGVPVVATDVGGVRELISDFEFRILESEDSDFEVCERGILVKRGDVEGFAKGLHYLLEHPDVCTEMGRRGRQYAMEKHTAERLVSDMDKLYQSLLIRNDKYI